MPKTNQKVPFASGNEILLNYFTSEKSHKIIRFYD